MTENSKLSTEPAYPESNSQDNYHAMPLMPAMVEVFMPDSPLPIKGKFAYFGIKMDGHDIANAHQSDVVRIDTFKGTHSLEIRQVNDSFCSFKVQRFEFQINAETLSKYRIESDGESLKIYDFSR